MFYRYTGIQCLECDKGYGKTTLLKCSKCNTI